MKRDLVAMRARHRLAEFAVDRFSTPDHFIAVVADAAELLATVEAVMALCGLAECESTRSTGWVRTDDLRKALGGAR